MGFEQIYEAGRIRGSGLLGTRAQKILRFGDGSQIAGRNGRRWSASAALYAIEKEIRGTLTKERRKV